MLYMSRRLDFSAAHDYRIDSWSEEKNKQVFGLCSNPNGHGHDYKLEVMVKGKIDPSSGMVVNIRDVDKVVKSFLKEKLDGKYLNKELSFFRHYIPTTENLVCYVWDQIDDKLENCHLHKVRVHENPFLFSEKGEGSMVQLTKKYHFSSAHRLHSDQLSDEENLVIFGKCNNVYGHGHNYYLEVTLTGEPDPVTGMVVNLKDLDEIVENVVLDQFDHKHLNLDTDVFHDLNPTSEVMTMVIWEMLSQKLDKLYKIGLWETEKNYFEYYGPNHT